MRDSTTAEMEAYADGILIHKVPRDGNCMFSSVAAFINLLMGNDMTTQAILRIIAASYISEENLDIVRDDMFSEDAVDPPPDTLHELVNNLTQTLWGGESTLLALVNFIQDHVIADFAFLVVHPKRNTTQIGSGRFVCCLKLAGDHYDLLRSDDLISVLMDSQRQVWVRGGRERLPFVDIRDESALNPSHEEALEPDEWRRCDYNPFSDI
jgi:hypothetical protein